MRVFTYDLLMDDAFLAERGVISTWSSLASVSGFALRIGDSATLIEQPGVTVYGVVKQLDKHDVRTLRNSWRGTRLKPIRVRARTADGSTGAAVSFVQDAERCIGADGAYASRLARLAERLALPSGYVASLRAVGDGLDYGEGKTMFEFYGA